MHHIDLVHTLQPIHDRLSWILLGVFSLAMAVAGIWLISKGTRWWQNPLGWLVLGLLALPGLAGTPRGLTLAFSDPLVVWGMPPGVRFILIIEVLILIFFLWRQRQTGRIPWLLVICISLLTANLSQMMQEVLVWNGTGLQLAPVSFAAYSLALGAVLCWGVQCLHTRFST